MQLWNVFILCCFVFFFFNLVWPAILWTLWVCLCKCLFSPHGFIHDYIAEAFGSSLCSILPHELSCFLRKWSFWRIFFLVSRAVWPTVVSLYSCCLGSESSAFADLLLPPRHWFRCWISRTGGWELGCMALLSLFAPFHGVPFCGPLSPLPSLQRWEI